MDRMLRFSLLHSRTSKNSLFRVSPSIEVYKYALRQADDRSVQRAVDQMGKAHVIQLEESLAKAAAKISLAHSLPMADSIILATARASDATLWTQDADFEGIEGVMFKRKQYL